MVDRIAVLLLKVMVKYSINTPERNLSFVLEHYYRILCSVCRHQS